MIAELRTMMWMVAGVLGQKVGRLRREDDRGDGGGHGLTVVLLTVAGVVVVGVVAAAIIAAVHNKTGGLDPSQKP